MSRYKVSPLWPEGAQVPSSVWTPEIVLLTPFWWSLPSFGAVSFHIVQTSSQSKTEGTPLQISRALSLSVASSSLAPCLQVHHLGSPEHQSLSPQFSEDTGLYLASLFLFCNLETASRKWTEVFVRFTALVPLLSRIMALCWPLSNIYKLSLCILSSSLVV